MNPTLSYDLKTGLLHLDTPYEYKEKCASCGFKWSSEDRTWTAVFAMSVIHEVKFRIPEITFDKSVSDRIPYQMKREKELADMKKDITGESSNLPDIVSLKVQPFNYQRLGIKYAVKNQKGVLIGDDMGLGKSLQGLGIALELKRLKGITGCIVVTPASLKYNWPLEIEKFTNEKCVIIDGNSQEKRLVKWLDDSSFFKIVNYELLVKDIFDESKCKRKKSEKERDYAERARLHAYRKVKLQQIKSRIWDLAIFDEIHFCKNYSSLRHRACKALKAKVKIGLSGTPMDGKLEEIFNIMDILAPGLLGSRVAFTERHIVTDFFGQVKGYKDLDGVKRRIDPFFIRRLKKEVLKQLPPKIYETKVIALTEEESKIYDSIKEGKHPCVLVEDKLTHEMVPVEPMVRAIRCKQFCNLPQMIEPKCKSHSKLDVFLSIMEELVGQEAHKAVIFSQYKEIIEVLDKHLKKAGYKFLRIDGDTPPSERASMQEVFNTDKSIDCMIGTEAMSTGLNLIGANVVINYDDNWQPSVMAQRSDRIHRIGQVQNCMIISFVCKDTIEEKIRGVLYSKDRISSEALGDNSEEAVLRKLSKKEMEGLL
jgi:SNF2 family DNA or RNA helicase